MTGIRARVRAWLAPARPQRHNTRTSLPGGGYTEQLLCGCAYTCDAAGHVVYENTCDGHKDAGGTP